MTFLDKHLGSNEKVLYRCRPSRIAFILEYILIIVAAIITLTTIYPLIFSELNKTSSITLETMGIILGIITLGLLVRVEYKIWSRRYALTDQRLMSSTGIFSEDFKSSVYKKVTDIGLKQSFFEKILNTGTVNINTAGSDGIELKLENIYQPLLVKKKISDMQSQQSQVQHRQQHQGQHLNNHRSKRH